MANDLFCNFKKCRKALNTVAWVTSCSHIFCDEDGAREFQRSCVCPACETSLEGKYDIVRQDLQPSEQYKSMVITGQKPEVALDVCSRAISFWTYQVYQEHMYQECVSTKEKGRNKQIETFFQDVLSRIQAELSNVKQLYSSAKKELEGEKKKNSELNATVLEKTRQYQKLQTMYEAMRRKVITPSTFEQNVPDHAPKKLPTDFQMPIATLNSLPRASASSMIEIDRSRRSPPEREFVLKPNNTPVQLSTSDNLIDITSRFNMQLGTPYGRPKNQRK